MSRNTVYYCLIISIIAISLSKFARYIHKLLEVKPDQCPYCGAWIEED